MTSKSDRVESVVYSFHVLKASQDSQLREVSNRFLDRGLTFCLYKIQDLGHNSSVQVSCFCKQIRRKLTINFRDDEDFTGRLCFSCWSSPGSEWPHSSSSTQGIPRILCSSTQTCWSWWSAWCSQGTDHWFMLPCWHLLYHWMQWWHMFWRKLCSWWNFYSIIK